jgi:uncharacterized membrane protein
MSQDVRPAPHVQLTPLQILALVAGGILLVLQWVILFREYGALPEIIPSHFNGRGEVDGHAEKSFLFLLPVIATFLFATMVILHRYPHKMNYPVRVTPENAKGLYSLSVDLVCFLAFAISATMFYLTYQTIQVAKGNAAGLGTWSVLLFLGLIFIPAMYVIIRMFKMK